MKGTRNRSASGWIFAAAIGEGKDSPLPSGVARTEQLLDARFSLPSWFGIPYFVAFD